jgi:uncharacterized protein (DUF2267 family)
MSPSRLDVLDRSIEKTYIWINDLADELGIGDNHEAYRVLRAVLHALRDHLGVGDAAHLAAQLPIFIRGVFYEGWDPGRTPERTRDVNTFLMRIASDAKLAREMKAAFAARAAAGVLQRHITEGESVKVLHALPKQLRELFEVS